MATEFLNTAFKSAFGKRTAPDTPVVTPEFIGEQASPAGFDVPDNSAEQLTSSGTRAPHVRTMKTLVVGAVSPQYLGLPAHLHAHIAWKAGQDTAGAPDVDGIVTHVIKLGAASAFVDYFDFVGVSGALFKSEQYGKTITSDLSWGATNQGADQLVKFTPTGQSLDTAWGPDPLPAAASSEVVDCYDLAHLEGSVKLFGLNAGGFITDGQLQSIMFSITDGKTAQRGETARPRFSSPGSVRVKATGSLILTDESYELWLRDRYDNPAPVAGDKPTLNRYTGVLDALFTQGAAAGLRSLQHQFANCRVRTTNAIEGQLDGTAVAVLGFEAEAFVSGGSDLFVFTAKDLHAAY